MTRRRNRKQINSYTGLFLYIFGFLTMLGASLALSIWIINAVFDHLNRHDVRQIEELKAEVMLLNEKSQMIQND